MKNFKRKKQYKNAVKMEILANKVCAAVGRKLEELYPGWLWLVECTWRNGVVTVKNISLHGDYGFVIHLEELMHDPDLKLVSVAGGELLERCDLPRGPRPAGIKADLDKQRDVRGNLKTMNNFGAEKR